MNTIQTTEYAVRLSQHAANGAQHWQAFIEAWPQIAAEGETCEAVLEEIGRKLHAEILNGENTAAPLSPQELTALEIQAQAMGHKLYGVFAADPGALAVFDEIERLRDQHTIGT